MTELLIYTDLIVTAIFFIAVLFAKTKKECR